MRYQATKRPRSSSHHVVNSGLGSDRGPENLRPTVSNSTGRARVLESGLAESEACGGEKNESHMAPSVTANGDK